MIRKRIERLEAQRGVQDDDRVVIFITRRGDEPLTEAAKEALISQAEGDPAVIIVRGQRQDVNQAQG